MNARELLVHLQAMLPTGGKARHALTLSDDGALMATVFHAGKWHAASLDEADYDRPPIDVAREICALATDESPPKETP